MTPAGAADAAQWPRTSKSSCGEAVELPTSYGTIEPRRMPSSWLDCYSSRPSR